LASLKVSPLYGFIYEDRDEENAEEFSSWPLLKDLKSKNNLDLKNLRLKKIEWGFRDNDDQQVSCVRITLSDGTASQKLGVANTELDESFNFPKDRPIRSVRVRHCDDWVYAL